MFASRYNYTWRIRSERFADQPFADIRPVGIGGVDEVDTQFDGAAQHGFGVFSIFRLTPHTVANNAHSAEYEAVEFEVAAQLKSIGKFTHRFVDARTR